jgi:hypothetical protein
MDGVINITERLLVNLLTDAAELGARRAIERAGIAPTQVSIGQAYRLYSRLRVNKWIERGYVKPIKSGNKRMIYISELDSAAKLNELTAKTLTL